MDRKRTKGLDAIPTIVHSENEQLRASAITRMKTLRDEITAAVKGADEEYRAKEQDFLAAVATWKQSANQQERGAAALTVGSLQRDLVRLDEERQAAKYPHRFIQTRELLRSVLNAETRDERKIPHPVYLERGLTTDPAERTILL
jgi:hypothetical protein